MKEIEDKKSLAEALTMFQDIQNEIKNLQATLVSLASSIGQGVSNLDLEDTPLRIGDCAYTVDGDWADMTYGKRVGAIKIVWMKELLEGE